MVPLFDHLGRPEFERPAGFALVLMLLVVMISLAYAAGIVACAAR
jgi:hypothetical protein